MMVAWSEHLFQYCERGHATLFWAEPLDAISNAAFLVAGGIGLALLRAARSATSIALTALLFAIATGGFLFHTFATRLAELGDQLPILIFVLVYLGFALRSLVGLSRAVTAACVVVFALVDYLAGRFECPPAGGSAASAIGDTACLWGSFAYLPALAALWTTALVLRRRGHAAARSLLAAAAVFTASLAVRTLDVPLCDFLQIGQLRIGTHFIWHLLNAVTLTLLVKTAIEHAAAAAASDGPRGRHVRDTRAL